MIRFVTYNIWNGQNGGLESALWGIAQANINLGFFQETKLTKVVYAQEFEGYRVVVSDALI